MVDAGIDDVLVPYNLVGGRKLEQLAQLLRRASDLGHRRRRGAAPGPRRCGDRRGARARRAGRLRHRPRPDRVASPEEAAAWQRRSRGRTACAMRACCTFPTPPGGARVPRAGRGPRRRGRRWRSRRAARRRCGRPATCGRSSRSTGPARTRSTTGTRSRRERPRSTTRADDVLRPWSPPRRPGDPRRGEQGAQLGHRRGRRFRARARGARVDAGAAVRGARAARPRRGRRARARAAGADRPESRVRRGEPLRRAGRSCAARRWRRIGRWRGDDRVGRRGRGRGTAPAPTRRRRGRVHGARRQVRPVAPAGGDDVRLVARGRRGGRRRHVACGLHGPRALRGPLVPEDLALPDPHEQGEDARRARVADAAVLVVRRRRRRGGHGGRRRPLQPRRRAGALRRAVSRRSACSRGRRAGRSRRRSRRSPRTSGR